MKKLLLVSVLMAATVAAFGQGAITWGNSFTGVERNPIYGADPADATHVQTGGSTLSTPVGTTVYAGPLLQGAGYTFAVFAGANASSMSLIGSTSFRTAATPTALPAGLVFGTTTTVAGVAAGATGVFQIRVWENKGIYNDWASALTAWQAGLCLAGESAVITTAPLGGTTPGGPVATPNTVGWSSFNVYSIVPEPSSLALAGLGAAAMMIFRRRR